jgi:hypothetical protein
MKGFYLSQLCIKRDWPEVRKYLYSHAAEEEKKSNIMYRNDHGLTCLYSAFNYRAPDNIIGAMLDIGGKESVMPIDKENSTVLHSACRNGRSYNIMKMLIGVGGKDLVMAKDNNGNTALHWLCWLSHAKAAEIIIFILQVGDANLLLATKNHAGQTPLKIATDKGAPEKIKMILLLQSNSNSRRSNNNSSASIVPANTCNAPTKQSNPEQHTTESSSTTNNDPNITIHRLQSQLKEARKNAEMIQQDFDEMCADYDDLEKEAGSRINKAQEQTLKIQQNYDQKCADCCHLEEINQVESTDNLKWGSALAMKSKELYQCKRMSEDLEKKNKDLGKVIEMQRADIALLVKQEEKSKKDNAHLIDRVDNYMQICLEQNFKLQDTADAPVAGMQIKCEAKEDEARQGEVPEQYHRTSRDLVNEIENERAEIAALSEQQSSIENECEDERHKLTQISSPKRKAEQQPLNESTIARSTKRKPCGDDHQEEDVGSGAVSQSQSSSRIGNAADTGSVTSGRSQAYDDDLEMIAKELLHEKDMYTKLMNRYLHARRELQRRG